MPIIATIAYILSPDRSRVLLIHRDKRPDDIHYGKYLGLGGRVEPDEDVVSGVRREIHEESGLTADEITLRGTIHWPGFGHGGDGWFGFVFRVDSFTGAPHEGNAEGTLAWVPVVDPRHPYRCGTATTGGCPWCSTATRASSTASCPTTRAPCSAGATSASRF
jgi:8-oxo-dGTP diphosphatase